MEPELILSPRLTTGKDAENRERPPGLEKAPARWDSWAPNGFAPWNRSQAAPPTNAPTNPAWAEIEGTRVKPTDFAVDIHGCWNWQLKIDQRGYGVVRREGRVVGNVRAHRWVYEQVVGPISEGMVLDHRCRNRRCVNPAHLEPVTHVENCRRGAKAKLMPADVEDIRRKAEPVKVQAARYGVSVHTIDKIRNGRRWAA